MCEYPDGHYICRKRATTKVGERYYCRPHSFSVQSLRAAAGIGRFSLVIVFFLLGVAASAQTVTSMTENIAATGTGFAPGDVVTAVPSGTVCTNVVIVSATNLTATCPDGTTMVTVQAPAPPSCTLVPASTWTGIPFAAQTANFEIVYTVTPSAAKMDGLIGLSTAKATTDNGTVVPVLFGPTGYVQMMNSAYPYPASTAAPYAAAGSYIVKLDVNMSNHTYNGYVGAMQVATNYAFRTAAGTPTSLGFLSVYQDSGAGTLNICDVTINPYPVPVTHSVALTWTPGVGGTPATSFSVERAATTAGPFTQVGSTAASTYTDTAVTAGSPYCYEVLGVAAGVSSLPSNVMCVTIPGTATKKGLWERIKRLFG